MTLKLSVRFESSSTDVAGTRARRSPAARIAAKCSNCMIGCCTERERPFCASIENQSASSSSANSSSSDMTIARVSMTLAWLAARISVAMYLSSISPTREATARTSTSSASLSTIGFFVAMFTPILSM